MKQNLIMTEARLANIAKEYNKSFDAIRASGDPCDAICSIENGKTLHLYSTLNGIRKVDVRYTLPIDADLLDCDFFDACG